MAFIVLASLVSLVAIALDRHAETQAQQLISRDLHDCHATPIRISSVCFDTERLLMDKTIRTYQVSYINAQGIPDQSRCRVRLYTGEVDWQDPP